MQPTTSRSTYPVFASSRNTGCTGYPARRRRHMKTRRHVPFSLFSLFSLFLLIAGFTEVRLGAQTSKYPPLSDYLMPRDAEVALAKSAAPANISDRATIKVLTTSGYQVVHDGDNGFVCLVMRGWT